jgi:uncharacterized protein YggE
MKLPLAFLALVFFAITASAQAPVPVVITQGFGTAKRAPDRAWVSIAVEARESKAADARTQAAKQMATVQAGLKTIGIAADAFKTTDFTLQPQGEFDGTRNRVNGYVVHNEIEVRVDNIDQIGDVIDAAGSVKTSGTLSVSISNVRFDLKNSESIVKETLGLAVQDALGRARAIATAAGRTIGNIVKIEEQPGIEPRPFLVTTRSGTNVQFDKTPIAPNEIEIRSSVSVTVALN